MSLKSNSGSTNESNNKLAPSSVSVGDASNSIISEVTGTPILPIPLSTAEADPEAAGLPPTPPQRFFAPVDFELFEDGYDSDGYIPPHLVGIDCINDLDQYEVSIGSHNPSEGKNTNREIFCQNLIDNERTANTPPPQEINSSSTNANMYLSRFEFLSYRTRNSY